MGAIVRILVFILGALGLILTALSGASQAGVDTNALLMSMGEAPGGVAVSAQDSFMSGLGALGGMIAGWMGQTDAENPGLVEQWGPVGVAGLVSALLMFLSTRR